MPDINEIATGLGTNPAVETLTLARELEAAGEDVIHMSAGEPDLTTPEPIITAAKEALDAGHTHYAPPQGIAPLREKIAERLRTDNDLSVSPDQVVVTMGGKQAIFESLYTILEAGDTVVLPVPAYLSYDPIVGMLGGETDHIETDPNNGFVPTRESLKAAITDDTKAFILNTPANPTGALYSKELLETIRDLAIDHDLWVLSDEIYEKLLFDGTHHSIGSLDGMADRTITINGFSKAYAMTGWRLGYAAGPERIIDAVTKVHTNSVTCSTSFVQHAAVAALQMPPEYTREIRSLYESRRNTLVDEFDRIGVSFMEPRGALYAFVPVPGNSTTFCERMLKEHHVAAVPGAAFGMDGYVRFSYTTSDERIREGINRIEEMFD